MVKRREDGFDRLVQFLAKRDGIDKLVKTFQYVSKLSHWRLQTENPELAAQAKKFEVACGLARKAFRTGRFLSGFNALRTTQYPDWKIRSLSVLGNAGEMVYFFFDHFTWMSRVGLIDPKIAKTSCFISASGEGFGYIFFIWADLILISRGMRRERLLKERLQALLKAKEETLVSMQFDTKLKDTAEPVLAVGRGREVRLRTSSREATANGVGVAASQQSVKRTEDTIVLRGSPGASWRAANGALKSGRDDASEDGLKPDSSTEYLKAQSVAARDEEIGRLKAQLAAIRLDRVMRVMAIAANTADLIIAINDVEPNPFVSHAVTLGISGLVSAWAGWYRNWPASP
eukprot:TRINITY_DN14202_c0_g1_i1.p1 TRINITY_DN14202_c0_g1~~TRINITY_DN14202_c0_g1_i1.p1  ORF type:complete len:345 (-),score=61.28 TRINITY_DN14202_c0_g1_i1:1110-2144(-)